MSKVHTVRPGTCHASYDSLHTMTDKEYASAVDDSPTINDAYKALSRVAQPMARACAYASVFGIGSRTGGPTKGDAPAVSYAKRDESGRVMAKKVAAGRW